MTLPFLYSESTGRTSPDLREESDVVSVPRRVWLGSPEDPSPSVWTSRPSGAVRLKHPVWWSLYLLRVCATSVHTSSSPTPSVLVLSLSLTLRLEDSIVFPGFPGGSGDDSWLDVHGLRTLGLDLGPLPSSLTPSVPSSPEHCTSRNPRKESFPYYIMTPSCSGFNFRWDLGGLVIFGVR